MIEDGSGPSEGPPSRRNGSPIRTEGEPFTWAADRFDAVVVGSGFGGTMAAWSLVQRGWKVLMLERGDWTPRGEDAPDWTLPWTRRPEYSEQTPYEVDGDRRTRVGAFHCVGGRSVVYGGVSLRLREADFGDHPLGPDLRWPFEYRVLEPHYSLAEGLLGVRGDVRDDPTDPPRGHDLPPTDLPLSSTSRCLRDAALRLGMRPFRLPLAIHEGSGDRPGCTACGACDGFACRTGAKNDLATVLLPRLIRQGLVLRPGVVVVRLEHRGDRVVGVSCLDRRTGRRFQVRAGEVIVAAGTRGTAHLLLASGADQRNPAGDAVGRYLMRHCNGIVLGASSPPMGLAGEFRKQIGIHDFYFGAPGVEIPGSRLGAIQQVRATRVGLGMAPLPTSWKRALLPLADRLVGFIVMAEDTPSPANRVTLDPVRTDAFGRPVARLHHRYSRRDRAARHALMDRAREVLAEAGVAFTVPIQVPTFSHALGTVRMGADPARFPVDPSGRFRGFSNLWVTDGSVFPTSGGVNPSLTIAANALRVGALIAGGGPSHALDAGRTSTRRHRGPPLPSRAVLGAGS